jgi:hypothetical protein
LLCPHCRRRCCALFAGEAAWLCSTCARLIYKCDTLDNRPRWKRRARKMQERLGLRSDVVLERLERPKGMRRSFFRLREAKWWQVSAKIKFKAKRRRANLHKSADRG